MSTQKELPVAVIGAGPVGLAATAHLITRGVPVNLYEAGDAAGAHVRGWGHVRLFSPWRFNIDDVAVSILLEHGWQVPPPDMLPTGHDLFAAYLSPLSQTPAISAALETRARVRSVSRQGIDKVVSKDRSVHPFAVAVEDSSGSIRIDLARAVIDASGTWQTPNPLGASGIPAIGEATFEDRIAYGIPTFLARIVRLCRSARTGGGRRALGRERAARFGPPCRARRRSSHHLGGAQLQPRARARGCRG
jgi:hypothetical protein